MSISTNPSYVPISISASTLIKTGPGVLRGFICSSTSAGTVVIYNSLTAAGTQILATTTPAANTPIMLDAAFDVGCYVAISGTIVITVLYV